MHQGAHLRTPIILLVIALAVVLSGGIVAGAEPHPVIPVDGPPSGPGDPSPGEPEAPPPDEPAEDAADYECADGSSASFPSGRFASPVRIASTSLVAAPRPVIPVGDSGPAVIEDFGPPTVACDTELVLRLKIISPNNEKPEGTNATFDAGVVPQATLESGYQATLPSRSRDIFLADPGEEWELTETSCICAGTSARSGGVITALAPGSASMQLLSAPAPVIPVEGGSEAIECGSASAAAPSGMAMAPLAELTAYPRPVIPVEGDGSIDLFDEPPPPATIDWDSSGTITIRDPFATGGVFLCDWTVEPKKGRLTIRTTTKPSGEEGRFRYRVTPQFVHEEASPFTLPGTSSSSPTELRAGTWSVESSEVPDAWSVEDSSCQETDPDTPSSAQGSAATAGIDGLDDVRCTFEMRLFKPQAGRWNVRERAGRVRCPLGSVSIPRSSSAGRITVGDEGDRLVGRGLAAGSSSVTLRRDRDTPRIYVGKIQISQQGASGRFDYEVEFNSERKATGLMTGKIRVQGQTCTLRRAFSMSR